MFILITFLHIIVHIYYIPSSVQGGQMGVLQLFIWKTTN